MENLSSVYTIYPRINRTPGGETVRDVHMHAFMFGSSDECFYITEQFLPQVGDGKLTCVAVIGSTGTDWAVYIGNSLNTTVRDITIYGWKLRDADLAGRIFPELKDLLYRR